MRAHRSLLVVPVLAAAFTVPAAPVAAGTGCDPLTAPDYLGAVPSPREVLGFDLGTREVTSAESDRYLDAVAAASPRVVSGTMGRSVEGRPLRYAIVGDPANVTPDGLARVRRAAAALRDPDTPEAVARRLARQTPAILWVAGNVHGNEESGADAALRTLRDLADRTDCAARRIVEHTLVVVAPVQNPDGREADRRGNAFGFDLNRDWFARTQQETDGKLALLGQYPPVLFVDAHEMGGTSYFFPPNADPVYHEITGQSLDWIERYGTTLAGEFTGRGIDFFTRSAFDLFYLGYGDTVPTTGFLGAGMTFEKGGSSPIAERTEEHFLTQWLTLSVAAADAPDLLARWHRSHAEAKRQGAAGELEPNEVINPGNEVTTQVPDRAVRHYFLRADDPHRTAEVRQIVRRLQRMGVEVRALTRPLRVGDFREYGRAPRAATLPPGTYWIPLAQGQKHWIQAMLNEDTYVPFTFFFDVSAWSLPLLANVSGGSSGLVLRPDARVVPSLPQPSFAVGTPGHGRRLPSVAVLRSSTGRPADSEGWLLYQMERVWQLPHRVLTPADVAAGKLAGTDALLVPDVSSTAVAGGLGEAGRAALVEWVNGGGHYVGWAGGTRLAASLGISTARLSEPTSTIPGTLFRLRAAPGRLAAGVGPTVWALNASDQVMRASDPAHVAVSYPPVDSPDWFVSGFARGAEELGGTAAVLDEPVGRGRAVVFAGEPNFRAFTEGTLRLVRNAVLGAGPGLRPGPGAPRAGSPERSAAERAASTLAAALPAQPPIRISVRPPDAAATAALLDRVGTPFTRAEAGDAVLFTVPMPVGRPAGDLSGWVRRLPAEFARAGVRPLAAAVPG